MVIKGELRRPLAKIFGSMPSEFEIITEPRN